MCSTHGECIIFTVNVSSFILHDDSSLWATPRFCLAAVEKISQLWSFLHSCEIKSGSDLGMRLDHCDC